MKVTPKTEQQIQESLLLPAGQYVCEVISAKETVSKSGNDMIVLQIKIYTETGSERLITDYLLDSMEYKIRHAAEAFGLLSEYESGFLTADAMVGKAVSCKIGVQKDKTGQYGPKNIVQDYIAIEKPSIQKSVDTFGLPELNDDIPF